MSAAADRRAKGDRMRELSVKEKYAIEQLRLAVKMKNELVLILKGLADQSVSYDEKIELHRRYITILGTLDLETIGRYLDSEDDQNVA